MTTFVNFNRCQHQTVFRQQCFSDARHNTVSATAQSAEGNPLIGRQTATTLLRPCHQIGETNRDGAPSFVDVANYSLRNRILGEYKDVCGIFGRMNDSEFGMVRDPTEVLAIKLPSYRR
jgi:hypothetical protein